MTNNVLGSNSRRTAPEAEIMVRGASGRRREIGPLELGDLSVLPANAVTLEGEVAEAKQLHAERDQRDAPEEYGARRLRA